MKLFDIETGKYLELGTDWLYGGNGILLIDIMQKELNESLEIAIANAMQGNEHALYQYSYGKMKTEPQGTLKTLCDLTGAVVYGERYVLMKCEKYDIGLHYDLPNENELDWYGYDVIERGINTKEYDVIKNFTFTIGDVFLKYDEYDIVSIGHSSTHYSYHQSLRCRRFEDRCCAGLVRTVIEGNDCEYVCNIFEEYSKSLCNEENKLEEIMNLIK